MFSLCRTILLLVFEFQLSYTAVPYRPSFVIRWPFVPAGCPKLLRPSLFASSQQHTTFSSSSSSSLWWSPKDPSSCPFHPSFLTSFYNHPCLQSSESPLWALVSMVLWFLFGGWWCFGHIAFLFCLEEEAPLITCGGGGFLFCMLMMVDGGTRTQIDIEILKHTHTHTLQPAN